MSGASSEKSESSAAWALALLQWHRELGTQARPGVVANPDHVHRVPDREGRRGETWCPKMWPTLGDGVSLDGLMLIAKPASSEGDRGRC